MKRNVKILLGAGLLLAVTAGSLLFPAPALAQDISEEYGFDHPGGDYRSFLATDLKDCKRACRLDRRCQAYTFLSRKQECYLKDVINPAGRSLEAITGVKSGYGGGPGGWGNLTEEWGYDRGGNDYSSFDSRGVTDCKRACATDRRCQAYTFLTRSSTCYLKDRAGFPRRTNGAVTGAKGGGGFNPFIGGLTEETGYDRRGDDYSRFFARGLDACKAACRRDSRCRAYSFLQSSGDCYLKNRINSREYNPDAVTGYKE
ncbi:MAG TPA: PAN/Apple domain-containing protein [Thermoanaerobaculia bacterium]|nr:PAN/Apple domain-containing protein [Thermoanaerobaculia bacterium]